MISPATSLRRRLLLWLLLSTAVIGALALFDTYREAVKRGGGRDHADGAALSR